VLIGRDGSDHCPPATTAAVDQLMIRSARSSGRAVSLTGFSSSAAARPRARSGGPTVRWPALASAVAMLLSGTPPRVQHADLGGCQLSAATWSWSSTGRADASGPRISAEAGPGGIRGAQPGTVRWAVAWAVAPVESSALLVSRGLRSRWRR